MHIIWQSTKLTLIEMPWFAIVRCKCLSYVIPGQGPEAVRRYSCRLEHYNRRAQLDQCRRRIGGNNWSVGGYWYKTYIVVCVWVTPISERNPVLHRQVKTFFRTRSAFLLFFIQLSNCKERKTFLVKSFPQWEPRAAKESFACLTCWLEVMADKWGRDILEQVPLWHKVADFLLKGTLSEDLLAECRKKLQDFETTMKGKASRIDWDDFRKWKEKQNV